MHCIVQIEIVICKNSLSPAYKQQYITIASEYTICMYVYIPEKPIATTGSRYANNT
jgi:hypothetical protein